MMRTLIFTGNGGSGSALAATATAAAAAASGRRTLLASIGPSHSLSTLLHTPVGSAPQPVGANLSAWNLDASTEMASFYQQLRGKGSASFSLSPDEFPLLPGIDLLAGIARMSQQSAEHYDLLVLDAGPHDSLLRALAVPDSVRWAVRLVFGLDRGPGRSGASLSSAMVPSTLMPFEWVGQLQEMRVQLEQIRDQLSDLKRTTVRYVLRPDLSALEEARLAVPALHLYGLAVDALVVAPLLPDGAWTGTNLGDLAAEQERVASEAAQVWEPRPLLRGVSLGTPGGLPALEALGYAMYGERTLTESYGVSVPMSFGGASDPFVSLSLPGLPNNALGLTLSGDEMIVRAGPYRRHILLPDSMRGMTNIRAARSGDRLVVRPRT
jgi:arsenite/tail-anchored protein-transporting ATPase